MVTHSISLKEYVKILEHNAEESGTLAILFSEVMEEINELRDVKIFAIDVDTRAIEQAGKGIFTESILEDVSPERLAKYFTKKMISILFLRRYAERSFSHPTVCFRIRPLENWT